MNEHIPILIIAVPLLTAFILPIAGMAGHRFRNLLIFSVIAAVNLMLISLISPVCIEGKIIYYLAGSASPSVVHPDGLDFPIRILLKIDGFSLYMAIISGIIVLVAFLFSLGFIKEDGKKNYYMILLLLMFTGMLGIEFTNDLFNFFVFFEILSISGAALVAYRTENPHPPYAGFKYLLISTVATSFYLIGVGLCYSQYGSFNIDYIHANMQFSLLDKMALIFMIIPLSMKAGVIPMHMWIPDTYSEAPAPISAVLKTSSMVSLYAVFRISFSMFGNPLRQPSINYETLGWIIIILGVLSMFIGVTMALIQHDVKRLMAFHAISQTGYMFLGIGVGMAVYSSGDGGESFNLYGKYAMTGGIFHIMNNAFYKGLLFLTSGIMALRFGTRNLNLMSGLAHKDVFTATAFIIGALAISGIPPFNGFSSKLLIYESVYLFSPVLSIIAMFVSILTLASFMKVFYSAFLGPQKPHLIVNPRPVTAGMKVGMGILCFLIIFSGLFSKLFINYLVEPAVRGLVTIL